MDPSASSSLFSDTARGAGRGVGAARPGGDAIMPKAGRPMAASGGFGDALARAGGGGSGPAATAGDGSNPRDAAEKLVSNAFIKPVLKMLREGNDAPPPWGPGPGEKQFGPLLDQRIADEVVRGAEYPLVDRVERELTRDSGRAGAAPEVPRASAGGIDRAPAGGARAVRLDEEAR